MSADDAGGKLLATLSIDGRSAIDVTGPITVGRDPRTDRGDVVVVDNDPLVSKSHLAIDVELGGFVITDLGSSNGTFLHHSGVETTVPTDSWIPIPPGAEIEFGDQRMTIDEPTVPGPAGADDTPTPRHGIVAPVPPVAPPDPWGVAGEAAGRLSIECANCRRQLAGDSRFCDRCGTPTSPASAAPISAQPGPAPSAPLVGHDPAATVVVPAGTVAGSGGPSSPSSPGPSAPFGVVQPGPPAYVDLSSSTRSSGGPLRTILFVAGVLVALGVAGVVVRNVLDGDDAARVEAEPPRVPDIVDELWSEPVRGESSGAFVDEDGVYVTSLDLDSGRVEVIGFDRRNGDERWQTEVEPTGVFADIAGGVQGALFVTVCDDQCSVVGLDLETGEELWSEQIGDGVPSVTNRHVYSVHDGTVEFFDPLNGRRLERVRGDDVRLAENHILVSDGDDVEVFDADVNSVLGPEPVDQADAIAFDGRRLIVAEGDELRFIDADGTVAKASSVDVGRIEQVMPVTDDNIILSSNEGVVSVDPLDGTAEERWSAPGELSTAADVDGGAVVIVDLAGSFEVVDADSGERRFERALDQPDSGFTVPGRNLLVVYEFERFDDPIDVAAYDWRTGDEVWRQRFDDFAIVRDGLVVEISHDGEVTVSG